MSGQYPPPNPAHPYTRVPLPNQRVVPPWGHTPQPTPGLNMVGSSMNYFGSPHMSLRGTQPWAVPPQSHPKPAETRPISANPLFGLQMLMAADNSTRIPSEYQQEESMDLSSHTGVSKPSNFGQDETSDVLRNGTINGEVERTETGVGERESSATSVIAANPLRESTGSAGHASSGEGGTVIRPEAREEAESRRVGSQMPTSDPAGGFSSVLKTSSCFVSEEKSDSVIDFATAKDELKTEDTGTEVDKIREFIMKVDKPAGNLELNESYGFDSSLKSVDSLNKSHKLEESSFSFLDSSALSVDTEESRLVVAESSAEDIFGISPVGTMPTNVVEENEKSKDSKPVFSLTDTFPPTSVTNQTAALSTTDQKPSVVTVDLENETQPQPSVENVEILLESMFNSQEDNSSNSQTSCGIPQSVIVSGSEKTTAEMVKPNVEASPMKVEDLASTLAEDTPVKSGQQREEQITDDVMQEIEKKLELLTESVSNQSKIETEVPGGLNETKINTESTGILMKTKVEADTQGVLNQIKSETEPSETLMQMEVETKARNEPPRNGNDENIPSTKEESQSEEMSAEVSESSPSAVSELPTQNTNDGTSNPFIEVENELEKMFAGIVEPVEEGGSENNSQSLNPEAKKSEINKRTAAKRKKANNRRPSDSSVFGGGSSGENTPVKKRGRKRVNDSGNDRSSKKMKLDSGEVLKKKKLPKDVSGDFGGKVKGPFVHIEGPKDSPSSVVVVNSGVRPDDEDVQKDKTSSRRKHSTVRRAEGVASRKSYSSSTLSARYNSESADLTWVCALCHRGPHCDGGLGGEPAGDLFGPYRVPAAPPADDASPGAPSDRDVADEQKRRGGKYPKSLRTSGGADAFVHKMGKKSKRSQSTEIVEGPGLLPVEGSYEVWLHSACAVWAPGLCVVGTTLVGLDDAVWTAIRTRCSACGEVGAGVGCVVRSCPARVHYPCARRAGWLLDHDTFIARCHVHRTRLRPS